MAFIPVPGVAQVNVNYRENNEPAQNTLYFASNSTIDTTNIQSLADDILAYWLAEMLVWLPQTTQLFQVEAFSLDAQEGPYGQAVPDAPSFGGVFLDGDANNVTISVSHRSGLRGRSHRGRNYLAGVPKAYIDANFVDVDWLLSVIGGYANMMGPNAVSDGWRWNIVSRRHNNAWRAEGIALPVRSVVIVDNVVDSMRNRLPGHNS